MLLFFFFSFFYKKRLKLETSFTNWTQLTLAACCSIQTDLRHSNYFSILYPIRSSLSPINIQLCEIDACATENSVRRMCRERQSGQINDLLGPMYLT